MCLTSDFDPHLLLSGFLWAAIDHLNSIGLWSLFTRLNRLLDYLNPWALCFFKHHLHDILLF